MGEPRVVEILARVREVLVGCRSYRDTGVVETRYEPLEDGGRASLHRIRFATDFVRPDRFRFEWAEEDVGPEREWKRMLVLSNEGGVRESWSIEPGVRACDSIHSALACATGVSAGSAWRIPNLLMPNERARDPLDPECFDRVERASFEGRACFRLQNPSEGKTLWIGVDDLLIHAAEEMRVHDEAEHARIRASIASVEPGESRDRMLRQHDESRFHSFAIRTTTRYSPSVGAEIPAERFAEPVRWPRSDAGPDPAAIERIEWLPSADRPPSGREILERTRARYRGCTTLRHRIEVESLGLGRFRRRTDIWFARPDRLRITGSLPSIEPEADWWRWTKLWSGGSASTFREDRGRRIAEPNSEPLLSRWSPLVVKWLFDAPPDRRLPLLESAELVGRSRLEQQTCLVVQARSVDDTVLRFWIDEARHLLVRADLSVPPDPVREAEARALLEARLARGDLPAEERTALEAFTARPKPLETHTTEFRELHRSELDVPIDAAVFRGE